MTASADRNLLFGLLALQNGMIDQSALVAAFHAWTLDKARSIAEILLGRGAIDADDRGLLEGLVAKHLKRHGDDVDKSLAAVTAPRSVMSGLGGIGDADVDATLGQVVAGPRSTVLDGSGEADATTSMGGFAGDGRRFRVLRPHARGGLGAVFVALDAELNREVALKQILDHHADDPASRTRFVLEAEITGGLEHPGIVPVYGLGSDGGGRPYYAMRFIRGDSLKDAIASYHARPAMEDDPGRRSLALRKLLRRFVDVCNAIEYAHTRGILHRDIKPANVIVGKHGETLVVDWGLAKAMGRAEPGSSSGERTLMPSSASGSAETLPGSAMGTPAYMSPEQASGDLDRLGPRSDVYSLGATLYCLLAGRPPFEGDDLGAVLRDVGRGEFPGPREVDPAIDRALEAVCLKAMALKPADRYPTPKALADDVERWAADEPVGAWREPTARRARRWGRRNRTAVTAGAVAVLALLFGTAAVLAVQTRANGVLKQANAALAIANARETKANADLGAANTALAAAKDREAARFNLAMDAIKLFHGEVSEDLLLKERKFEGLRGKLLRGAADFYGKLEGLLEGQSDLKARATLARSYSELADITTQIGKGDQALALRLKSLAVRRELASRPGAGEGEALELVRGLYSAARARLSLGGAPETLAMIQEATALAERLVAAGRASDPSRKRLAECLNYTAILLNENRPEVRDPARAIVCNERALAIAEGLAASNPGENESAELLSAIVTHRGILLHDQGRRAEAVEAQRRSVAISTGLAEANPNAPRYRDLLARAWWNLVGKLSSSGRPAEAMVAAERALASWQRVVDENPAVSTFRNNLAFGLNGLGYHIAANGEFSRAMEAHERARSIMEALAEADPSVVGYKRNLARSRSEIGWMWLQMGRPAEALPEFRRELATRRGMEAADPTNSGYRDDIANCETNIAEALLLLGRPGEGRESCDRAIATRRRLIESEPSNDEYRTGLGESLLRSGQLRRSTGDIPGAADDWRRAVGLFEGLPGRSGDIAGLEACCHAMLSDLAGLPGGGVSASDGALEAEKAVAILRRIAAEGVRAPLLRVEPTLDPLRDRPDFRALRMDLMFPADPFAVAR